MKSVNCTHSDRRMEIHSVELKQNSSFCEKQNLHESLTKCIQMKVNAACNGKQTCEQVRWCEPMYVNISFSCKGKSKLSHVNNVYITYFNNRYQILYFHHYKKYKGVFLQITQIALHVWT